MTSRRTLSIAELDLRLAPAAADPTRFEALAEELLDELEAGKVDLEIADPLSWRKPRAQSGASQEVSFLTLFRAEVEAIELLDREPEAALARRIELARLRLKRARRRAGLSGGDPLEALKLRNASDAPRLPRDVVRRTEELHALRCEMVERNLYLVLVNVERYVQDPGQRVDLVQEGSAALFRAVDGFDWRRGLLFRTYAVHWLNQAFRNYIYNFRSTVRVPVYLQKALKHVLEAQVRLGDSQASTEAVAVSAELEPGLVEAALGAARSTYSMDATFGEDESDGNRLRDILSEDQGDLYSPRMEDLSLEEGLARAMECLSAREQLVIRMRFGIGDSSEHTLAEVAAKLGVSVERVRQIQVRAIAKMNNPALLRELEPYLSN